MTCSLRRTIRNTALASCALLVAAACAQGGDTKETSSESLAGQRPGGVEKGSLDGVTMTFTSYGGGFQDGQEAAFVEPFAKAAGAEMLTDEPTDSAKIRAQVESGNVLWDVVDSGADDVAAVCGTLFEPLDYSIIDTSKLPETTPKHECYVPSLAYAFGMFYDADTYKDNPPDSWDDFFDSKDYPGKRAVDGRPTPTSGTFEAALLADGVAPKDLYPLDANRALKTYDKVRNDLIYWETGAQQTQIAEAGEADIIFGWSGRIFEANKNGANFVPVWHQAFALYDVFAVVKGSPNKNAAMSFINYTLGAEQQARMSELTSYSPVNVDSTPDLDSAAQEFNTTRPEVLDQLVAVDIQYWADEQEALTGTWTGWLNK